MPCWIAKAGKMDHNDGPWLIAGKGQFQFVLCTPLKQTTMLPTACVSKAELSNSFYR